MLNLAVRVPAVDVALVDLDLDAHTVWDRLRVDAPVAYVPAVGLTMVTRHDDVDRVCRDTATFSAETPDGPLVRTLGPNFMHADGCRHLDIRNVLAPLLRARTFREHHEVWLRDLAGVLAAGLAGRHEVDLVGEYAHPLSVALLARLSGVEADAVTYERWFRAIAGGVSNFEQDPDRTAAAQEAGEQIDQVIRRTASSSRPDGAVRVLMAAGCTPQQVSSTVKLLIIGGLQEPRDLLGFCVLGLLDTGQWSPDLLDRGLIPVVVEEGSRWGSPVGTVTRTVVRDTVFFGHHLEAGTPVAAVIASANHDPDRWVAPHDFALDRALGPHWAYGAGAHACVGAAAARSLVRIALEELLRSLPELVLAAQPLVRGYEFRGPDRVLVSTGGTP